MPIAKVNGLDIAYELHGEGEPVVVTPGGRFSMDCPGVRELGLALAESGKQALIWDRPTCGASDISFEGDFESNLHADTLAGLIKELDLGPVTLTGGSAGARVSLITALRHPEVVSKLGFWWPTGGFFGLLTLAQYYCGVSWEAAKLGGMKAVAELPAWQETLEKNPKNRECLLAMDRDWFVAKMEAWGPTFMAADDSPVPGLAPADFAQIDRTTPTMVFRTSSTDLAHMRRTSEWIHELMPASRLVEPPWGENEWNDRHKETEEGGKVVFFKSWPMLAPQLIEFMNEPVPATR